MQRFVLCVERLQLAVDSRHPRLPVFAQRLSGRFPFAPDRLPRFLPGVLHPAVNGRVRVVLAVLSHRRLFGVVLLRFRVGHRRVAQFLCRQHVPFAVFNRRLLFLDDLRRRFHRPRGFLCFPFVALRVRLGVPRRVEASMLVFAADQLFGGLLAFLLLFGVAVK